MWCAIHRLKTSGIFFLFFPLLLPMSCVHPVIGLLWCLCFTSVLPAERVKGSIIAGLGPECLKWMSHETDGTPSYLSWILGQWGLLESQWCVFGDSRLVVPAPDEPSCDQPGREKGNSCGAPLWWVLWKDRPLIKLEHGWTSVDAASAFPCFYMYRISTLLL